MAAEKIAFLFGTKRYLSNATPAAPQGSVNVVWTSDGENISASVPSGGGGAVASVFGRTGAVVATAGDYTAAQVTGAVDQGSQYANPSWITSIAWAKVTGAPAPISQTPWTQDIDAAGFRLKNAGTVGQLGDQSHSWNLDNSSGSWRHIAAGYGHVMTSAIGDGYLRVYTSQTAAAGAVATLSETASVGPDRLAVKGALEVISGVDGSSILRVDGSFGFRSKVGTVVRGPSSAALDAYIEVNRQYYAYFPSTTQMVFRVRCDDGVFRQVTLTLA